MIGTIVALDLLLPCVPPGLCGTYKSPGSSSAVMLAVLIWSDLRCLMLTPGGHSSLLPPSPTHLGAFSTLILPGVSLPTFQILAQQFSLLLGRERDWFGLLRRHILFHISVLIN